MERVITTRKTSAKELENKLKQALEELRSSKDLCKQLLQEREDSEEEIRSVIRRNTDLKGQLAELHTNYLDILAQRDHLSNMVNTFDQQAYHELLLRFSLGPKLNRCQTSYHEPNKTISLGCDVITTQTESQKFFRSFNSYHELSFRPNRSRLTVKKNDSIKVDNFLA